MQVQNKRRLGRGLAALIGEEEVSHSNNNVGNIEQTGLRQIPIAFLHANPANPRKAFSESELDELARSIGANGLLQPILARQRADGEYEIVAGERRWRAAQRAGLHEVPALIRELDDAQAFEIALIENIQRSDLNALEEAQAFSELIDRFGYSQQQLADQIGKSRSHISNMLRLLNLPDDIKRKILEGKLSAGHARSLITAENPEQLAEEIIQRGLSVRETEDLVRDRSFPSNLETKSAKRFVKDLDSEAFAKRMSEILGLVVKITPKGQGGQVLIKYDNLEQLDHLSQLIAAGAL